jgi:hypothetical protein
MAAVPLLLAVILINVALPDATRAEEDKTLEGGPPPGRHTHLSKAECEKWRGQWRETSRTCIICGYYTEPRETSRGVVIMKEPGRGGVVLKQEPGAGGLVAPPPGWIHRNVACE